MPPTNRTTDFADALTSSPWFAAASLYTQATYVTPPMPATATALSFGLNPMPFS